MTIDKFGRHLNVVGSTHQTIIDKFGRHLRGGAEVTHSAFLPRTSDGNYDVGGKRLCNIQDPKDNQDCATKNYVTNQIDDVDNHIVVVGNELSDVHYNKVIPLASSVDKHEKEIKNLLLLENKMNAHVQSLGGKIRDSERQLKLKLDKSLGGKIRDSEKQLKQKLDILERGLNNIHLDIFTNKLDEIEQGIQIQLTDHRKRLEDLEKK